MTKKDCKLIAEVVRDVGFCLLSYAQHRALANRLAEKLKKENSHFDEKKFLDACYGE